ncbi:MAG: inositol monophosphatase [Betaproteobacteria bacterium]|nr:inositol monophosphatase [Betaproteobacteria bacterium]
MTSLRSTSSGSPPRDGAARAGRLPAQAVPAQALDVARAAAGAAGALLREAQQRRGSWGVHAKGPADVVTDVDREAEALIVRELLAAFPGHAVLGEESGLQEGAHGGVHRPAHTWIVDPIDGTLNFAHGVPHYCVSIALAWHDVPVCAAVYDPVRDEMYHASAGGGAWLGDQRLRASDCARLDQALLAAVFPKPGSPLLERFEGSLLRAMRRCAGLRRSGSMVLDLAWVAAGRLDGFWQWGMQPWDIAAGSLLVLEAGGHVAPIDLAPGLLQAGSLLACASPLAGSLRALCTDTAPD